jgi:thiol-disulfide isomerase/thioredoxin
MKANSTDAEWATLSDQLKSNIIRKRNLVEGAGYSFRVRYLPKEDGAWSEHTPASEEFFVLDSATRTMEAPTLSAKDDVSVTIQWKEVEGAGGYLLRYRTDQCGANGDWWTTIGSTIKGNLVRKKGLSAGVNYYFSIIPTDLSGGSEGANWSFSPSSSPCKVATLSPSLQRLLPDSLLVKKSHFGGAAGPAGPGGSMVVPTSSVLSGVKCVAVYVSAHWCGPCRQFTPQLLSLYKECKALHKSFEVVFCSADNSEDEFAQYYSSMAWSAIGFDEDKREGLMGMLKVKGIPRLCILNSHGRIVVDSAINGSPLTVATVDHWVQQCDAMM